MKHLVGIEVIDKDGTIRKIINATSNSVEIAFTNKTKQGINCTNWFSEDKFYKRFSGKGFELKK